MTPNNQLLKRDYNWEALSGRSTQKEEKIMIYYFLLGSYNTDEIFMKKLCSHKKYRNLHCLTKF